MRRSVGFICCLIALWGGGCLLSACRPDCSPSVNMRMGVSFWRDSLNAKYAPCVRVHGVGSDSILYDSVASQLLMLPLHDAQTVTEYEVVVFAADTLHRDTTFVLHIEHTPLPQFISQECGCAMYHSLQSASFVGENVAKTITVISNQVTTNDNEVHLQVHF